MIRPKKKVTFNVDTIFASLKYKLMELWCNRWLVDIIDENAVCQSLQCALPICFISILICSDLKRGEHKFYDLVLLLKLLKGLVIALEKFLHFSNTNWNEHMSWARIHTGRFQIEIIETHKIRNFITFAM